MDTKWNGEVKDNRGKSRSVTVYYELLPGRMSNGICHYCGKKGTLLNFEPKIHQVVIDYKVHESGQLYKKILRKMNLELLSLEKSCCSKDSCNNKFKKEILKD